MKRNQLEPSQQIPLDETETPWNTLDKAKQKRLEADGWRVGTVEDFLGLPLKGT